MQKCCNCRICMSKYLQIQLLFFLSVGRPLMKKQTDQSISKFFSKTTDKFWLFLIKDFPQKYVGSFQCPCSTNSKVFKDYDCSFLCNRDYKYKWTHCFTSLKLTLFHKNLHMTITQGLYFQKRQIIHNAFIYKKGAKKQKNEKEIISVDERRDLLWTT